MVTRGCPRQLTPILATASRLLVSFQRLVDIYYKGEITIEQSAERVGFALPTEGEYPGLLQKGLPEGKE